VDAARERWRVASADLARLLRLDSGVLVEPVEPPQLQVALICPEYPLVDLISVGLTNRPELAANQALVQAALQRLRQERIRPLVPSVLLRGASTNPAGTLSFGEFGGGQNEHIGNFSFRSDFDIQILWEWQNLGFGNRALVNARRAEHQLTILESFRTQDRVAAEVTQAHAQLVSAAKRIGRTEWELRNAVKSADLNYAGSKNTRRIGNVDVLAIRPQEVLQSVQALAQAFSDYYGAVADYNRAQFRLYRAIGRPAQQLADDGGACSAQESGPVPRPTPTPGPTQANVVPEPDPPARIPDLGASTGQYRR
jgi:outer membrane protein TolC